MENTSKSGSNGVFYNVIVVITAKMCKIDINWSKYRHFMIKYD